MCIGLYNVIQSYRYSADIKQENTVTKKTVKIYLTNISKQKEQKKIGKNATPGLPSQCKNTLHLLLLNI